jgi:Kef-type K+ transport system membrane component KefB
VLHAARACWGFELVAALTAACAVIMLVCRFVGLVFKVLGQPTVIGEIIAGVVLCAALRA